MQALTTPAILTGASTRLDGSLGLRFATPELNSGEKVAVLNLIGKNLKLLIQPEDQIAPGLVEVQSKFDGKKPSQRLRAILYCLWKQQTQESDQAQDFETFYRAKIEGYIERVRLELTPQ